MVGQQQALRGKPMPEHDKSPVRIAANSAVFYLGSGLAALPLLVRLALGGDANAAARRFLARQSWLLRIAGAQVQVTGTPPQTPAIYAAQHESTWETLHFTTLLNAPAMFAKAELFRLPLIGFVARKLGHIPLARGGSADGVRASLRRGADVAATGRSLLIFPSGTRRQDSAEVRAGVAVLYQLTGLPVVPVRVASGHVWPARGWPIRPGTIRVEICDPIPAALPRAELLKRLKAEIGAGT